jgi:nucleoside-diphosphate-sugar epimerase
VTLRPARLYGPRDRALAPAIRGVARRRFPLVGRGDARVDFLYVGDLVDALVAASRRGTGAYVVGGPESVTIRGFFEAFAGALGTRLLPFHLPTRATLAASAAVAFAFGRAGVEPPVAPKKIAFFLNTRRVSSERARRELDWRPVVRVPEGAQKTVLWYRSAKWV